jgi:hypothetical protein
LNVVADLLRLLDQNPGVLLILVGVGNRSRSSNQDRQRNKEQGQSFDAERPVCPISVEGGNETNGHSGRTGSDIFMLEAAVCRGQDSFGYQKLPESNNFM